MLEILSISEKKSDMEKFNFDWEEVRTFIKKEGLDGIEVVFGYDPITARIPNDLVRTVHLPVWLGWIRTWREPHTVPDNSDPFEIATYYGAQNPEKLIGDFQNNLRRAVELQASHAVFHIGHIELEEVYTQSFRYGQDLILSAAASFMNAVCSRYPRGEPPVTLAFENLWSSGLTFRSEDEIRYFCDLLAFDNWMFVLDTGHLMNGLNARNEREGIEKSLMTLERLSDETVDKIRAIHFQCSISGEYQQTHLGCNLPSTFPMMSYREKIDDLMQYLPHIDEHRPFSDPLCREIIDKVQPGIIVHELVSRSRDELHRSIQQQKALIIRS